MIKCLKCKEDIDEGDTRITYGRDGKPYCYSCGYHPKETNKTKGDDVKWNVRTHIARTGVFVQL